jgi:hypothetical protein
MTTRHERRMERQGEAGGERKRMDEGKVKEETKDSRQRAEERQE